MQQKQLKNLLNSSEKQESNLAHHSSNTSFALVPFNTREKRTNSYILKHMKYSLPPGTYETKKSCFQMTSQQCMNAIIMNSKLASLNKQFYVQFQRQPLKNQSHFFKSQVQRFQQSNNIQFPGPLTYNIQGQSQRKQFIKPQIRRLQSQSLNSYQCQQYVRLPSIPNEKAKFGYIQQPCGKFIRIQKTQSQLENQKIILKRYQKQKIDENLQLYYKHGGKYYRNDRQRQVHSIYTKARTTQSANQQKANKINYKKPGQLASPLKIRKQSLDDNIDVLKKIRDNKVGPGSYHYNLNTLKIRETKERYQFFGSTQKRFPQKALDCNYRGTNFYSHQKLEQIKDSKQNLNQQAKKKISKKRNSKLQTKLKECQSNNTSYVSQQKNKANKKIQFKVENIMHQKPNQKSSSFKNIHKKNVVDKNRYFNKAVMIDEKQNINPYNKLIALQIKSENKVFGFNSKQQRFAEKAKQKKKEEPIQTNFILANIGP